LVYFPGFGILYQEKSGNPGQRSIQKCWFKSVRVLWEKNSDFKVFKSLKRCPGSVI
jgi:hypothetical protein